MQGGSNDIVEKFKALPLGEKIILIAAPLFVIDGFLPWFDYGVLTRSAWSGDFAFLSILAVFASVAMVAQIAVARFTTVQLPALPQGVTWPRVHLGLGAYVALAVVIRLILGESVGPVDADRAYGLFIAVILAAALAAGGFLMFQEERGVVVFGGTGGTSGASTQPSTCKTCGAAVPKGVRFCRSCGADQSADAQGKPQS